MAEALRAEYLIRRTEFAVGSEPEKRFRYQFDPSRNFLIKDGFYAEIEYPFAETKPAFEAAVGRPSGEVWLQRPRKDEGSALVYDVYDRKSKWRGEVAFPPDASLAGFGAGDVVYAAIKNPDGSRTIGRSKAR